MILSRLSTPNTPLLSGYRSLESSTPPGPPPPTSRAFNQAWITHPPPHFFPIYKRIFPCVFFLSLSLVNMKVDVDDSFRKPGAVPFKWEIRPGVPRIQEPPSLDNYQFEFKLRNHKQSHSKTPSPETPSRLKPPPAGYYFQSSSLEPRTRSFRSNSKRFRLPGLARPDVVSSAGCFPSPMSKRRTVKKGTVDPVSTPEPGYYSDLEIGLSRRLSVSSRKSGSPLSYSYRASPRPVGDSDWAGFGLF